MPFRKSHGLTEPSARAEMTSPRADSDLLIILASSSTVPSAPVLPTCQIHTRGWVVEVGKYNTLKESFDEQKYY